MADSSMDYKCGCNYSTRLRNALVEVRALVSEQECRGDEDCDHCLIIHGVIDRAFAWPEEDKPQEPETAKSGGVLQSDNGGYTASCPICREWASKAEPCDHNYTERPFISRETAACVCELRHRQFNPHTGRCETCGLRRHMPSGLKTGDENFKPATCPHTHRQAVQSDGGCVQCIPEETMSAQPPSIMPGCTSCGQITGHSSRCGNVPEETVYGRDTPSQNFGESRVGDSEFSNNPQGPQKMDSEICPEPTSQEHAICPSGLSWCSPKDPANRCTRCCMVPVKPPREPCTKLPDCPCSRCETIKGLSEAHDRARGKKT